MQSVGERVRTGARFLDQQEPDWEMKVDPGFLFMESNFRCVLGQLFGSFGMGMVRFDLSEMQAAELGFTALTRMEFSLLAEEWRRLLEERQTAALNGAKPAKVAQ